MLVVTAYSVWSLAPGSSQHTGINKRNLKSPTRRDRTDCRNKSEIQPIEFQQIFLCETWALWPMACAVICMIYSAVSQRSGSADKSHLHWWLAVSSPTVKICKTLLISAHFAQLRLISFFLSGSSSHTITPASLTHSLSQVSQPLTKALHSDSHRLASGYPPARLLSHRHRM